MIEFKDMLILYVRAIERYFNQNLLRIAKLFSNRKIN